MSSIHCWCFFNKKIKLVLPLLIECYESPDYKITHVWYLNCMSYASNKAIHIIIMINHDAINLFESHSWEDFEFKMAARFTWRQRAEPSRCYLEDKCYHIAMERATRFFDALRQWTALPSVVSGKVLHHALSVTFLADPKDEKCHTHLLHNFQQTSWTSPIAVDAW